MLVILAILFFEQIIASVKTFKDPVLYLIIPTGAAILAFSIGFLNRQPSSPPNRRRPIDRIVSPVKFVLSGP